MQVKHSKVLSTEAAWLRDEEAVPAACPIAQSTAVSRGHPTEAIPTCILAGHGGPSDDLLSSPSQIRVLPGAPPGPLDCEVTYRLARLLAPLKRCGCHCVPVPCPIGNEAGADATTLAADVASNCKFLQTKCRMDTMRA